LNVKLYPTEMWAAVGIHKFMQKENDAKSGSGNYDVGHSCFRAMEKRGRTGKGAEGYILERHDG
jgi:hypothetical protein